MATIFDVAKYILEQKGDMSTWKLQKLCYYSQAWSIAWTEHPIFQEDFEAWRNGPVCPELFAIHKGKFFVGEHDIKDGSSDNLNEDQKESIDVVLKEYSDMDPYDLRELTHLEAPWKNARGDLPSTAKSNTIISKEAMGVYYGGL